LPFTWRDIEPREGVRDWTLCDAQIEWCRSSGFKVCGGPLLAIDRWSLPDWMYLWGEEDLENFHSCVAEHIQEVVNRYRGKVHLWLCAAGLNVENDFGHGEDERLRLAVMAIESIRRADPRSPIVLSIDQPWGSFMSHKDCDLSPLHFADALVRAEMGLAGIGVEINFGYSAGGSEPRDPLEFGRQIDRFSSLGMPLLVSLTVPSDQSPDPRARRRDRVVGYATGGQLSSAAQREWGEAYLRVLLAKQPVQGIIWNQLLDSQPHPLAHGGVYDEKDQPKPIVELMKSLRREYLT
jgi:Glycosyl hydrolase family 10